MRVFVAGLVRARTHVHTCEHWDDRFRGNFEGRSEAALRITKLDPDGTGAALPKDAEPGAEPHWQLPSTGQLHRRRFNLQAQY